MPTTKQIFFGLSLVLTFLLALVVSRLLNARRMKSLAQSNANVRAFLYTIRQCEGTAGSDGYQIINGYCKFNDFSAHPNRKCSTGTSTAAGAYQFVYATWRGLQSKLMLSDFSPASQDAAAVELIRERGALDDVLNGDVDAAVRKLSNTWESFTYGKTSQPHKSLATIKNYFTGAGGNIA
jgi:lysozyme